MWLFGHLFNMSYVIWSSGHLVIVSSGHLVILSSGLLVITSSGHLVIWWSGNLVLWAICLSGDMVIWSKFYLVIGFYGHLVIWLLTILWKTLLFLWNTWLICAHSESCFGDLIEQSGYLVVFIKDSYKHTKVWYFWSRNSELCPLRPTQGV